MAARIQQLPFNLPALSFLNFISLGEGGADLGQLIYLLAARDSNQILKATPGTENLMNDPDGAVIKRLLAATFRVNFLVPSTKIYFMAFLISNRVVEYFNSFIISSWVMLSRL